MIEVPIEESLREIKERLTKIEEELKRQGKRIDYLYDERDLLEDISGKQSETLDVVKARRKHDETIRKDIKEEIAIEGLKTRASVETHVERVAAFIKGRKGPQKESWIRRWFKK